MPGVEHCPTIISLLSCGGKKYMVAYDHDGQVIYYRRDLLNAIS